MVPYNVDFARLRDFTAPFEDRPQLVDEQFSPSTLVASEAVSILSQALYDPVSNPNDQAILGFARGGTPIAVEPGNPETWFPGNNPAAGDVFNEGFYNDFVRWTNARLTEITDAGNNPVIRGLFWYQGERDAVIGSSAVNAYETNLENLVFRFREDFGSDLPVVAPSARCKE